MHFHVLCCSGWWIIWYVCISKSDTDYWNIWWVYHWEWCVYVKFMTYVSPRVIEIIEIHDVCITGSDTGMWIIWCMYHQEWYWLLKYMMCVSPEVILVCEIWAYGVKYIHLCGCAPPCVVGNITKILCDVCECKSCGWMIGVSPDVTWCVYHQLWYEYG